MCINTNCELWAGFESTQTTLSELHVGIIIEYRANFQHRSRKHCDRFPYINMSSEGASF